MLTTQGKTGPVLALALALHRDDRLLVGEVLDHVGPFAHQAVGQEKGALLPDDLLRR